MSRLWTQVWQVARWLLEHGSITQVEAARQLQCWRLGARIWDLRRAVGADVIHTEAERHRHGTHARYVLRHPLELSLWIADQENRENDDDRQG